MVAQVIRLHDAEKLVPTSEYPDYGSFPFEEFNTVQSAIFDVCGKDSNLVIASATSSGKTVMGEMSICHEVKGKGHKAIFLTPLKALTKEKIDDWSSSTHQFGELRLAICTGDYQMTEDRKDELDDSDIILMTSEMLSSRIRNAKAEKNEFLQDVKVLVIDEAHLLTVEGRGDDLEAAIMKFTQMVPNAKIVLLSATMPNVDEIAGWLAEITKKDTYLLESDYRPCPLSTHYRAYDWAGSYEETEKEKVEVALELVKKYPNDKFLIFTHTKKTGNLMLDALKREKIYSAFHYSNVSQSERLRIEKEFKQGDLRHLVATSTLAWGVETPARRVIILGVHRGITEVDTWDIFQMVGRAGRPRYDPRGDAYVLLPQNQFIKHKTRLSNHQKIISRMLDHTGNDDTARYKNLAFHMVSEIHRGGIKTREDIHKWYRRSFAYYQLRSLREEIIDVTLRILKAYGVIKEEEDGQLKVTMTGMLSSMFYYNPFDVADLKRNFTRVFATNTEENDHVVSVALANVDSFRESIVSKAEVQAIDKYKKTVEKIFGQGTLTDAEIKGGYLYYTCLTGGFAGIMAAQQSGVKWDFPRTSQVLKAMDAMSSKWNKASYFEDLEMRMSYGCPAHLVKLCQIPEIGSKRALTLYQLGIRNAKEVVDRFDHVKKVLKLNETKMQNIKDGCDAIVLTYGC